MSYTVPFSFALKYLLCTNFGDSDKFYIRMKTFILLCITYIINSTNAPNTEPELCGFQYKVNTHQFFVNTIAVPAVILTLCLPKLQAEAFGEMCLILVLSYLTNMLPINLFLQLGSRSAHFHDIFKGTEEFSYFDVSFVNGPSSAADTHVLMYVGILTGLLIQGYLSEWLLEITMHHASRSESMILQGCLSVPLLTAAIMKYQRKRFPDYIMDSLPVFMLLCPALPIVYAVWNIEVPPNPFSFKIPYDKWKALSGRLGHSFFFKWYFLLAKLTIKYNINTNDGMPALRGYFYARVIKNLLTIPYEQYDWGNFQMIIFLTFHQDYMAVLGSSAFISRIVKYLGEQFIAIHGDKNPEKVEHFALGCIPVLYIILGWCNVHFECRFCPRITNFEYTILFLTIIFMMYMYSSAWQEASHSVKVGRNMTKHAEYIKVFVFLTVAPAAIALFYHDSRTSPDYNIIPVYEGRCCYEQALAEIEYDEEEEKTADDYVPIVYFVYQVSFFSFMSLVSLLSIMTYSWMILEEEDEDDAFEYRLMSCYGLFLALEGFLTVIIFDSLSRNCTNFNSIRYMLSAMAICNFYCAVFDRGYCIGYKTFTASRELKNIMDNMVTIDEDELEDLDEPECAICEDDIEENGKQAACGHIFHYFCIREWIGEYGPACPECNQEFKGKARTVEVLPPDDDDDDDDPSNPNLDPNLVLKIFSEMQRFDLRTSFYTESTDQTEKKEIEDSDDEYDSDDDD